MNYSFAGESILASVGRIQHLRGTLLRYTPQNLVNLIEQTLQFALLEEAYETNPCSLRRSSPARRYGSL
jgi:hypothetical protein